MPKISFSIIEIENKSGTKLPHTGGSGTLHTHWPGSRSLWRPAWCIASGYGKKEVTAYRKKQKNLALQSLAAYPRAGRRRKPIIYEETGVKAGREYEILLIVYEKRQRKCSAAKLSENKWEYKILWTKWGGYIMLCGMLESRRFVKIKIKKILQAKYFDALHDADLCIIMA